MISKIEIAVLKGGQFAVAMPRGSGKTSLVEASCTWAVGYAHRDFVVLVGANEDHAMDMLESIKIDWETNELLAEDFPEICYPVKCLEGIHNRAPGQTYHGVRTDIGWTAKELVLPTIAGAPCSESIIRVRGITGAIRGMKAKSSTGAAIRPQLVIIDDPQTDESARSLSQCRKREDVIARAIMGLAGPGKKIAAILPCTVIAPGDMADRILDDKSHPQWQGERTKMVYEFPTNMDAWERYREVLFEGLRQGKGIVPATEYYLAHQETLDAGSRCAWPERFNYDESSAIQHAMNKRMIEGEAAFFSEYQNEPLPDMILDATELTGADIVAKANDMDRYAVPTGTEFVTCMVDVQQKLLYYSVIAWAKDFTGHICDYGVWPDQGREYFTLRDAQRTLAIESSSAGLEGSIYNGLKILVNDLCGRAFIRDDGAEMRIDRLLIDANWGQSTDVVYQYARDSPFSSLILPSHGRGVPAASQPFSEYKRKRGDRVGHNWRIPAVAGKRVVRHILYDTNFWKSFLMARYATAAGDRSCLSIYGKANEHRLLADHMMSEYRVRTEGRGREVDQWSIRPERDDNHWFDTVVGCCVGASYCGCEIVETMSGSNARAGHGKRVYKDLSALRERNRKRRR